MKCHILTNDDERNGEEARSSSYEQRNATRQAATKYLPAHAYISEQESRQLYQAQQEGIEVDIA